MRSLAVRPGKSLMANDEHPPTLATEEAADEGLRRLGDQLREAKKSDPTLESLVRDYIHRFIRDAGGVENSIGTTDQEAEQFKESIAEALHDTGKSLEDIIS